MSPVKDMGLRSQPLRPDRRMPRRRSSQDRHHGIDGDVELLGAADGWLCWPDQPDGRRCVVGLPQLDRELIGAVDGAAGKLGGSEG